VIDVIDREQWMTLDADVKGDAYEGLLAKNNAEDVKSGAGQYLTPRPLIQAIADVMRPDASMRVCDPAAGTGGFLLAAFERMKAGPLDPDEKQFLRDEAFRGWEIVDAAARLCAMSLLLHGISAPESPSVVTVDDALRSQPSEHFGMVLTNPPFGRKSSYKVINAMGEADREDMSYLREDFWATTSNKQLNFLQHVRSLLTINGRAAVVLPDNVLFEGGAGEVIRRKLLAECDVHTLLRLPTGIFYAGGVASRRRRSRGRTSCGSTTSAPTSGSPSKPAPWPAPTLTTSSPATTPTAAMSVPRPNGSAPSATTSSSYGTRHRWTSSVSATSPWKTPRICLPRR
jgi:type I restriction enzyme M protein